MLISTTQQWVQVIALSLLLLKILADFLFDLHLLNLLLKHAINHAQNGIAHFLNN